MRIRDLLAAESIELNGSAAGKQDVLNKMVDLMAKSGKIRDVETYRKGVFAREEEGTTGIGEGIAIPHCKSDAVKAPGLAAMVVKDGVEFDALDGAPVNLLFLIAAPNTEDNVHLEVLSKLSVLLMDENFTNGLKNAKTVDEFLKVIDDAESAKDEDEKEDETGAKYKVLAVTGCPTGIAHTYMAAESLEKHAAEMGITIKVETRGSGGAKHVLTDEEIAGAAAIIVAADTKVPMDRFDGKKVIECKVADGINKVFIDKYLEVTGGVVNAETMPLLNGYQHSLLGYHFLREEINEGGFVQLIQNGFGPYIFDNPFAKAMRQFGAKEFAKLIYSAKKIYDENRADLEKDRDDEEFMAMYEQYEAFDELEEQFMDMEESVTARIAEYVDNHIEEFAEIV